MRSYTDNSANPQNVQPQTSEYRWSDQEFIIASYCLNKLQSLNEKMQFICEHDLDLPCRIKTMFLPEKREVEGINYEYGILETFDSQLAKKIAEFLIKRELPTLVEELKKEIISRLDKCETSVEKVRLLETKIAQMRESLFPPFVYYPHDQTGAEYGFTTEAKKDDWTFEDFESKRMNSNVDYRNYFVDVLNGAVLSKLSLFTQEKIDELKNPKSAEIENLNNLTTVNAKLLYIKHSGLFEVLSKIHNSIDVRIAKSISYISGEKVSTIKGLIPNLKKGYSSQVTKNTPYTNEAIRQATKCLLEAGLNTNGLEEILFEIERKDQDK